MPLPQLEKINIVDTPGLNSIQPEHEATARAFIARADAVVWVFTANQGGKASEKKALQSISDEGKRVLGVLNKADQLSQAEIDEVTQFIGGELGELVETIVPFSARHALDLEARRAGHRATATGRRSRARSRSGSSSRRASSSAMPARVRCARVVVDAEAIDRGLAAARHRRRRGRTRPAATSSLASARAFAERRVHRRAQAAVRADRDALPPRRARGARSGAAAPAAVLVAHRDRRRSRLSDRAARVGLRRRDRGRPPPRRARARDPQPRSPSRQPARSRARSASMSSAISSASPRIASASRCPACSIARARTCADISRAATSRASFATTFRGSSSRRTPIYHALYRAAPDLDREVGDPLARAATDALDALARRLEHWAAVVDVQAFDLEVGVSRALELVESSVIVSPAWRSRSPLCPNRLTLGDRRGRPRPRDRPDGDGRGRARLARPPQR